MSLVIPIFEDCTGLLIVLIFVHGTCSFVIFIIYYCVLLIAYKKECEDSLRPQIKCVGLGTKICICFS